jgi:hypothetical protein
MWPVKQVKNKVKEKVMNKVIASLLRHALTFGGGAGLTVSDNELELIAAGLATVIGTVWSVIKANRESK